MGATISFHLLLSVFSTIRIIFFKWSHFLGKGLSQKLIKAKLKISIKRAGSLRWSIFFILRNQHNVLKLTHKPQFWLSLALNWCKTLKEIALCAPFPSPTVVSLSTFGNDLKQLILVDIYLKNEIKWHCNWKGMSPCWMKQLQCCWSFLNYLLT